ncbi:MAG: acyloxyacyl hydrolase [Sphingomonadaceae bacterium]
MKSVVNATFLALAPALALISAAPAVAGEVYGGIYAHAVDTPFTLNTDEHGTDFQIGVRGEPIEALSAIGKPQPYVMVSVNSEGYTDFVAAGLAWKIKIGGPVYVRPGVGLSVNDGPSYRVDYATMYRTDLGSRVLFEPELAVGFQLNQRVSLEASWVHISGAKLFNPRQNPGIDMMGLRANYRF